ncbi:MAG: hypothetical protein IJ879_09160, partial [Muribaculaceae bacterium]|nr:hypothetical protein [Muribaculaceae bacterium]
MKGNVFVGASSSIAMTARLRVVVASQFHHALHLKAARLCAGALRRPGIALDEAVFASEFETGDRNRAIVYL